MHLRPSRMWKFYYKIVKQYLKLMSISVKLEKDEIVPRCGSEPIPIP